MRALIQAGVVAVVLVGSACYHARIETGAPPSDVVVQENMATSWLWGLVKPELVNVTRQCVTGVAMVETKHSFVNGLLHVLTGGIFTPMTIVVTCAKSGDAAALPANAPVVDYDPTSPDLTARALQDAVSMARASGQPVVLRSR